MRANLAPCGDAPSGLPEGLALVGGQVTNEGQAGRGPAAARRDRGGRRVAPPGRRASWYVCAGSGMRTALVIGSIMWVCVAAGCTEEEVQPSEDVDSGSAGAGGNRVGIGGGGAGGRAGSSAGGGSNAGAAGSGASAGGASAGGAGVAGSAGSASGGSAGTSGTGGGGGSAQAGGAGGASGSGGAVGGLCGNRADGIYCAAELSAPGDQNKRYFCHDGGIVGSGTCTAGCERGKCLDTGGGTSGWSLSCTQCLQSGCSEQYSACRGGCLAYVDCALLCPTTSCLPVCEELFPAGARAGKALFDCLTVKCSTPCKPQV
jgi:hypothetical protein